MLLVPPRASAREILDRKALPHLLLQPSVQR